MWGYLKWHVLIVTLVTAVAACASQTAVAGQSSGRQGPDDLALVAFTSSQPGWDAFLPVFATTPEGGATPVVTSYGPSADLSQNILDGKAADIVNFADEPNITRLVRAGKIAPDWNAGPAGGRPYGSVVTLLVRKGNPRNIRDWPDLLQPGVEVLTPNPLHSGLGKWALLAAYSAMSKGNRDRQAGLDYLRKLILEHVNLDQKSVREAVDAFLRGKGDVLITPESGALNFEGMNDSVEHITPPQTLRVDNLVAQMEASTHKQAATRLLDFLYTIDGQRLWARAGFRPVNPRVAREFSAQFPMPDKLRTIDDLGGWNLVDPLFFDQQNGLITRIFKEATE
jgi:sulfate/thiosulfate-binding protein